MSSWQWSFLQTWSHFSLLPEYKLLVLEKGQQNEPHQLQFSSHGVLMISIGQSSMMWGCNMKHLWWVFLSYLPFAPTHPTLCPLMAFFHLSPWLPTGFFHPSILLDFGLPGSGASIPAHTSLQVWWRGSPATNAASQSPPSPLFCWPVNPLDLLCGWYFWGWYLDPQIPPYLHPCGRGT